MARKKRQLSQMPMPAPASSSSATTADNKPKTAYQDEFQRNVNKKIEDVGKKFEGKGKNVLYGLAALAVLAVLIGIFYVYNRRSNAQAQTALGKAIETSQLRVTDTPLPAGSTERTFKTEKERAEAAIGEFQAVVDKYDGEVEEKAKYFIAVNRLQIDRAAAIPELEALTSNSGETGKLAKFALAQAKTADGKLDEAVALYQQLANDSNPVIAKETINFELAKVYEKQGKKQEAADLYFTIAKAASEAKDLEGKPVQMSQTATVSKERLTELNPEKAKEIVEPTPENPFGGAMPGGIPFGQ